MMYMQKNMRNLKYLTHLVNVPILKSGGETMQKNPRKITIEVQL